MKRLTASVLVVAGLLAACGNEPSRADQRASTVTLNERMTWARYATPTGVSVAPRVDEAQMLADMIGHHQDAIDASRVVLQRDPSPAVRDFAERLIRVQSEQVASLQSWLDEWYPDANVQSTWEPLFADMDTTETDAAYVSVMVVHHEHAVAMYRTWVASGSVQHNDFGLLLRRVAKGQIGEIALLRQLAAALA